MKIENQIIVLGPSLNGVGGVANYYSNINLHSLNNISYFEVNSSEKENFLKLIFRLFSNFLKFSFIVSKKSVKIIHVNPSLDVKSFWRDAIFIIISRIFSKKIIVFFRGWEDSFEEKIKNNFLINFTFKSSYLKANRYIVLGDIFRSKLLNLGLSPTIPISIETTVADSSFLKDFNLQNKWISFDNEIKVLFISRIEKEKGIYISIDAFHSFYLKFPSIKIKLVVAGSGKELNLVKDYVNTKKIENIEFVGYVKSEQKGSLLHDCHIMLFPTYYGEGLPNSILEGMLYGMPIISRINAGIPDIVKDDINGFITNSLDPNVFCNYLEKIILDKSKYIEMSKVNYETALNRFTSDKVKERLLNIYSILNNK